MFGSVDIIVGTEMPMPGRPDTGKRPHARMQYGSPRGINIGMTDMFLWKAAGDRFAAHGLKWTGQRF